MVMRQEVRGLTILTPELYSMADERVSGGGAADSVTIDFSLARNLALMINAVKAHVFPTATLATGQDHITATLDLDEDNDSPNLPGGDGAVVNSTVVAIFDYTLSIDVTNGDTYSQLNPSNGYDFRGLSVIDRPINIGNLRWQVSAPTTNDFGFRCHIAYQIVELSDELLTRFLRQRV